MRSGVRRPLDVPSCLTFTGPHAFIGINNSSADAGVYSVVGGGQGNQACDPYSTVVGGSNNLVSGTSGTMSNHSFIGGGEDNWLTGTDDHSAILGGFSNSVTGAVSAIIDGDSNVVAASSSFIGAGRQYDSRRRGYCSDRDRRE